MKKSRKTGITGSVNRTSNKVNSYRCCICGETHLGFGNNPYPVKERGRCCDYCNSTVVIPTRYLKMLENIKNTKEV